MKYEIHGKNIEVSQHLRNNITTHLDTLEKYHRYINENTVAHVEVRTYSENIAKISVRIFLTHNEVLLAEAEDSDLNTAIKIVLKPLEKQLKRLKDKNDKKGRTGISDISAAEVEREMKDDSSVDENHEH